MRSPTAWVLGLLVALGAAVPVCATGVMGAQPSEAPAHRSVGVLERDGEPVCGGALVGRGWAITAAHWLDEDPQALRLLGGRPVRLPLGRAYRSPDGGDLALIEVPDAAALNLPHLALPSTPQACAPGHQLVTLVGAAHAADGRTTRIASNVPLQLFETCGSEPYTPMIIAMPGVPARLCPGDSGSPLVRPHSQVIQGVTVSKVLAGTGACGRPDFAIGFAEHLHPPGRGHWLARVSTPPPARRAFGASPARMKAQRIDIHVTALQGGPPPGTRVTLVARTGRTWARTRVKASGDLLVRRPPPGTYRLRFRAPTGVRWSTRARVLDALPGRG